MPLKAMEPYILNPHQRMQISCSLCDHKDTIGMGRLYEVRRQSTYSAVCMCHEWGPLLPNDKTQAVYERQDCTDRLDTYSLPLFARLPWVLDVPAGIRKVEHLRVVSGCSCVFGNVLRHHAASSDGHVRSDVNILNYANIRTNIYVVAYDRCMSMIRPNCRKLL